MRRWTIPALLIAGVLLLALGERALGSFRARSRLLTHAAEWIWESRERRDLSPAAFYAVRDFELGAPPAQARLLVSGEEQYILYLNGARIGAGAWRPGSPLDVWEVGPLLQPGGNRLLAEVRSDSGAGGFLLSLQDGAGRPLLQSDGSWRIFHQHQLGLLRGWLPLAGPLSPADGTPAHSWGLPPLGRWGAPRLGPVLPLYSELAVGRPLPAATALNLPALEQFPKDRPQPPLRLFDWGRVVTGYLLLDGPPAATTKIGLLYTGSAVPPQPLRQPEASGIVVMPGRHTWMDAQPRRFRYALVAGIADVAARVQEVDGTRAAGLLLDKPDQPDGPEARARGVLGIVPPPLRTPVEDEVWRELERVPGVAGGKER